MGFWGFGVLGVAYNKAGFSKEAKYYFLQAIQAKTFNIYGHKHDEQAWQNVSYYLFSQDSPQIAIKYLKEALLDYPNNIRFLDYLAIEEYKIGNQKEALSVAEKAKSIISNDQTNYVYNRILSKQSFDSKP